MELDSFVCRCGILHGEPGTCGSTLDILPHGEGVVLYITGPSQERFGFVLSFRDALEMGAKLTALGERGESNGTQT